MSKRGENIYKRKDNRWEGRYCKGRDETGKVKYGYVYAKTYREVKEKLQQAKAQTACDEVVVRKDPFAQCCKEWLELQRPRLKDSTYAKYYGMLEHHILKSLGQYSLQDLNAAVIERFGRELMMREERPLSAQSCRDVLTLLHTILKDTYYRIGQTMPEFRIAYPREGKKEMRVLSCEEQATFVSYLCRNMGSLKFGILLSLLTGMRIGELCALRWRNVDLETRTIFVCATMQRLQTVNGEAQKTRISVGTPKSETSKRLIPLTNYAYGLCLAFQSTDPDAYVLTGSADQFMEPRLVQYHLKRYTEECGLDNMHFHVLRHTFATRCVEVGVEMKSLSEILGHASVKITMDRYVHSSLAFKQSNMKKLEAIGM